MDKVNDIIDSLKDDLIESTREIVRIKSVQEAPKPGMPYGEGIGRALKFALELSEKLGFKTVNLDGHVGYAEFGDGNEIVGVLGHLDVVPEGDGWAYPPYGAKIHDGKIYGRGSMDDKGPIIAALYGLKAIMEAKIQLSRRVRIIFGTNEESGSKDIPYYLERDEAPAAGFTPDGEYPVIYAEKGILFLNINKKFETRLNSIVKIKYIKGGSAPNVVPDYCEAALEVGADKETVLNKLHAYIKSTGYSICYKDKGDTLLLISRGRSAHGSVPHLGENAIMHLLMYLSTLDIAGDVKAYIDFFTSNIKNETKGESLGLYFKDEMGELSLNVGVINLNEERASTALNIRYPVTFTTQDVMNNFMKSIEPYGFEIEKTMEQHPLYFPKDHQLIKTLSNVYREQTGQEPFLLAIGGGTYAKEMPNTVAFGPLFPGKPDFNHQANEYIEVDDLVLNAKIYGNAIYELAK